MDRSIDPKPAGGGDDPATSRELPGQVLDNLLEGVQVISPEYRYLYVNEAVVRHVTEAIPGIRESDPALFEVYGRVARGGGAERFEMFVEALHEWFDVSVFSPHPDRFVAVFDVVTARKRTESSLRQFNDRLERLAQTAQDLSMARTLDTIVDIALRAARELVGADGATFVLRDDGQCHYLDEDAIAPLWKGKRFPMSACISGWCMIHREPAVIEDVFIDDRIARDAYESTFIRSMAMVPIRTDDPIGAIGVYWAHTYRADEHDVHLLHALAQSTSVALENVRVLEELAQSEARTRAIFDHLPNATFLWRALGSDLVLDDINEVASGLTQGGALTFIGRLPSELGHEFPQLEQDLRRSLETRSTIQREIVSEVPARPTPSNLVLTYGFVPPDRVLLIIEDVTDRRRNEEQIQTAQRLEAIGRLAGGVAHDFNNLLTVIINYSLMAADQLHESDPMREDLTVVADAGRRAAAMTMKLLAFSRRQVLELRVLNINDVITSIEPVLRRLLGEDVDIHVELDHDLGSAEVDPSQIEQVLLNLAVNARDAMPVGGKLTIETTNAVLDNAYAARHVATKPGRYVQLAVSDTGEGMDEDTQAQVFEPFFTTKDRDKGTGLGLAMVYGIVKQSGGNIWVYSEIGRGTTFKIYLPRIDDRPEGLPRIPDTDSLLGNEMVLVAEDVADGWWGSHEAVDRIVDHIQHPLDPVLRLDEQANPRTGLDVWPGIERLDGRTFRWGGCVLVQPVPADRGRPPCIHDGEVQRG